MDASLVPKFAEILPSAPTVKHVIVTGGPLDETPGTDQLTGVGVHRYEDLLAAEADAFDWPSIDEYSAAAMCYTSGTTGRPKGVVYSHRSTYLHSMGACLGNAFALSERDRVLPVVPMFHANAWGLAYACLLSGAALVMPDRDLTPPRWSGSSATSTSPWPAGCRRSGPGFSTTCGRRAVTCPRSGWWSRVAPPFRTR